MELLHAVVDGGHKSAQDAIRSEVLLSAGRPSFLPALFSTVRNYSAHFPQKAVRCEWAVVMTAKMLLRDLQTCCPYFCGAQFVPNSLCRCDMLAVSMRAGDG